jgi:hypothetical protein
LGGFCEKETGSDSVRTFPVQGLVAARDRTGRRAID